MNILFISKHKYPHIGGVEVHIRKLSEELRSSFAIKKKNYEITTISSEDIKHPKRKILGLLYIWYWFLKNLNFFKKADIIHIHDVFIWYLPFKFLYPKKKVYITFHGWEGKFPLTVWSILNKRVANYLCNGSIAIGKYIEKYYGIKADHVIYGAVTKIQKLQKSKTPNSIVWLGRQDFDTGINEFKKWLKVQSTNYKVKYITNVKNPEKYLKTAEYCVPSGYLSYLEAKNYGCKRLIFPHNKLKEDYWNEVQKLKKIPTWDRVTEIYLKLWQG